MEQALAGFEVDVLCAAAHQIEERVGHPGEKWMLFHNAFYGFHWGVSFSIRALSRMAATSSRQLHWSIDLPTTRSTWPQVVQLLWGSGFGILDFRRWQARREKSEHRTGNVLGIYCGVAVDAVVNACQEQIALLGCRASPTMPALIVEAPQEDRQTGPEVDSVVAFKTIAQSMQGCDQSQIGTRPIVPL
jgi:hypothetical protein